MVLVPAVQVGLVDSHGLGDLAADRPDGVEDQRAAKLCFCVGDPSLGFDPA